MLPLHHWKPNQFVEPYFSPPDHQIIHPYSGPPLYCLDYIRVY